MGNEKLNQEILRLREELEGAQEEIAELEENNEGLEAEILKLENELKGLKQAGRLEALMVSPLEIKVLQRARRKAKSA